MAKISYKATCRKLINEVPYPVTWDHLRWRQAIAGAESSVGLMPVIYGTDALTNRRDGGLILKVRMERRKPPEAIVDGMHRKRIAAIKTTLTKEENFAIYEQVKAEVWNVTPPKIKDVFVKIKGQEVYVFSDTGTAEKVTAYLRQSFSTFPVDRMWDGAAFSALFINHLLNDGDMDAASVEEHLTFTRARDRASVTIDSAPSLYTGIVGILSDADTVSGIGFRSGETGELATVTSIGTIQGVLEVMAGTPGEDDDFSDFLIYAQQVECIAAEIRELSQPFCKHEDVENGTS